MAFDAAGNAFYAQTGGLVTRVTPDGVRQPWVTQYYKSAWANLASRSVAVDADGYLWVLREQGTDNLIKYSSSGAWIAVRRRRRWQLA